MINEYIRDKLSRLPLVGRDLTMEEKYNGLNIMETTVMHTIMMDTLTKIEYKAHINGPSTMPWAHLTFNWND